MEEMNTWKNMVRISEGETGTETVGSTSPWLVTVSSSVTGSSSATDLILLKLDDFFLGMNELE